MANETFSSVDSNNVQASIEALRAEHRELQERLDELDARIWLTPEEEIERKNCQKLKLLKKDKIHSLKRRLAS